MQAQVYFPGNISCLYLGYSSSRIYGIPQIGFKISQLYVSANISYFRMRLFFTPHFVNLVVNINWFADVELVLDSSNKSHLTMVYDCFNLLLNLVY